MTETQIISQDLFGAHASIQSNPAFTPEQRVLLIHALDAFARHEREILGTGGDVEPTGHMPFNDVRQNTAMLREIRRRIHSLTSARGAANTGPFKGVKFSTNEIWNNVHDDLEQARKLIRLALERMPDNPDYAWGRTAQNRALQAFVFAEAAVNTIVVEALAPGDVIAEGVEQ